MSELSKTIRLTGDAESPVQMMMLALAGSMFLAVCARIQVPMWPVPMTMQTFGVMALGLALGARLGMASVALYLVQGAVGLPVFASGAGPAQFIGPTGGYLIGFLPMVWLIGMLADRGWSRRVPKALIAAVMGSVLLYVCGGAWLGSLIGLEAAFIQGVVPFVLGDLLKSALAALAVSALFRMLESTS